MAEKTPNQQLAEKLLYKPAYVTDKDADVKQKAHDFAEGYKKFLDAGKTERLCAAETVRLAEQAGYKPLVRGQALKAGDKVYAVNMAKAVILFIVGTKPIEEGMNILGAHIDSPRLDAKQNPLYEESELAYLDTHYYGGVKKYQWVTLPLATHGVVAKKDGSIVEISIGEDAEDPVLYITDLLIHLSGKQLQKKAAEVIEGEMLDILIGSRPLAELPDDSKKDAVKQNVLKILNEKYGIEEEDFLSAELEIVPAGKAREGGLDRSMIIAYGQDDRVCAFTSLFAMLEVEHTERASCCLLVDKEEIGSVGATGMHSRAFENTVAELIALNEGESELKTRRAMANSRMLSSDVSAAYDPSFADAFEKREFFIDFLDGFGGSFFLFRFLISHESFRPFESLIWFQRAWCACGRRGNTYSVPAFR